MMPPDHSRRAVLGAGVALATTLAATLSAPAIGQGGSGGAPSRRPSSAKRKFVSPAVEAEVARVSAMIGDPELAAMFANCYPNTLDTTVLSFRDGPRPDAFVITGDIPALWLRDSAAQLHPYLPLVRRDPRLAALFRGLIGRHARSVLLDPYANAFLQDPRDRKPLEWGRSDLTDKRPGVAERKWEIDSLCYVLRLAYGYWQETRDPRPFDAEWVEAARAIVRTFREQQRKDGDGPYRFQRASAQPSETLQAGLGAPTRKVGLIHSGFRPSDDACIYPFLIPANLFAVRSLRQLAELATTACREPELARDATALATEVERALVAHGRARLPDGRTVWTYEVDGYGNTLFMDDANVPSLSALGYLGAVPMNDPLWRRTADAAWSEANPWFFRGTAGEGIGGPHQGRDNIWPMSIIVRALQSDDPAFLRQALRTLKASSAGTGFIHETFHKDDVKKFTRAWFAWANGLFGEMIVRIAATRPAILRESL